MAYSNIDSSIKLAENNVFADQCKQILIDADPKRNRLWIIIRELYVYGKTQQEIADDPNLNLQIGRSMISKEHNRALRIIRNKLGLIKKENGTWK